MVQISRRHTRKANGFNSSVHALATTPERGTQKKSERFLLFSLVLSKNKGEGREDQKREKVNEGKEYGITRKKSRFFFAAWEKIAKGESIVSLRVHKNNDANREIFVHRVDVRRLSFKLWHFCHRRCPIVKKLRRGREPNCLRL